MKTKMKVRLTSVVCMMLFASAAKAGNLFEISPTRNFNIPTETDSCSMRAARQGYFYTSADRRVSVGTFLTASDGFVTDAIPMTLGLGQNLVGNLAASHCNQSTPPTPPTLERSPYNYNESVGFIVAGQEQRLDADQSTWDSVAYFPDADAAFPGRVIVGSALSAVNASTGAGYAFTNLGERLPFVARLMKREKIRTGCTYKNGLGNNDNDLQSCFFYTEAGLPSSLYSLSTTALPLPNISCPNGMVLNGHVTDMNEAGSISGRVGCGNPNGNLSPNIIPSSSTVNGQRTQSAVVWTPDTTATSGYAVQYLDRRDENPNHPSKGQAILISEQGEIAGERTFQSSPEVSSDQNPHAFVWKPGLTETQDIHDAYLLANGLTGDQAQNITTKAVGIAPLNGSSTKRVVAGIAYTYNNSSSNNARNLSYTESAIYRLVPNDYKAGFVVYGGWDGNDFYVDSVVDLQQRCKAAYPAPSSIRGAGYCKTYISGMNENGIVFGNFYGADVTHNADMTATYNLSTGFKAFIYDANTWEFKEIDIDSLLPTSLTRGMTADQIANTSKEAYSINNNNEMLVTWGDHYFIRTLDLFETLF